MKPYKKKFSGVPRKEKRETADTPDYDFKKINERTGKTPSTELIRLNRAIANSGVCSRREADQLIQDGKIKVNGKVVTELGYKVQSSDKVYYNGKLLQRERMVYVLLNKPKDFITTTKDEKGRKTVMSLVSKACEERIYPVGRLDRNTTGLLIFTNDGELAKRLTHPSHKVKKIYQLELDKPIEEEDFNKIVSGVELEDGVTEVDDLAVVSPDRKTLGIEIHSGKNRVVRRIFETVGYEVVKLDRTVFADLTKKDLPRGKWRFITERELLQLKRIK